MASTTDARLLRQTKFPPEFNQKVDMKKVNIEVMKKWIAGKISDILGNEDDVVIELCFNLLEGSRFPDIKNLQIQLTGFLDKDTGPFCKYLWNLCLSAQSNPQGVPKELLEAKKLELLQEKLEAEKAAEEVRHQRDVERRREEELENLRRREREERGGGRRDHRRGFDRRRDRDSRSPPPRRRSPDRYYDGPPRRRADTYVPSGRRRPLSSSASRSPSHSPSPRRSRPVRRRSPASSRSRSRRSPSNDRDTKIETRADVTKEHESSKPDRRLSRSRERRDSRREPPRRSPLRSNHRRRRSRSRSGSRSGRKRSIVRYAPAGRRNQRESPSNSPPANKRQKIADPEENQSNHSTAESESNGKTGTNGIDKLEERTSQQEHRNVRLSATELRERLMKEKVKAMRRPVSGDQAAKPSK